MPDKPRRIYWDACVPMSYINAIPGRVPIIDELLRQARAGEIEIVTSVLSRVEVAFAASEKSAGALDAEVAQKIDGLWDEGSPIVVVEFHALIADRARNLVRQGIDQGWGALKPADAIHLATAQQMSVVELHTYDDRIQRWHNHAGFPVTEPTTPQGVLDTTTGVG
jgi:predicted nucleic acid-binding protein